MGIWKKDFDATRIPTSSQLGGAAASLGIELVEIGDDFLKGKMPVDQRTTQPYGILHGGSSCVLAETLGSVAANLCISEAGLVGVGQSLSVNHLRPASKGYVWATAKPKHIGRKSQVWEIEIVDDAGKPTCLAVLSVATIEMVPGKA
jgi:1,4-dihydroxy-2-naphthoyl-CoA hydrolase